MSRDEAGAGSQVVLFVTGALVLALALVVAFAVDHYMRPRADAAVIAAGPGPEATGETRVDLVPVDGGGAVTVHTALVAWVRAHSEWTLVSCVPGRPDGSQRTDGLVVVSVRKK